ncbi:MAG: Flp family type IVb pilin [Geminicoccaceae bacterium]
MRTVRAFLSDDSGATAIEYGLIAALVSVAIITILGNLGTELNSTFTTINTKLQSANTASGGSGGGGGGGGSS